MQAGYLVGLRPELAGTLVDGRPLLMRSPGRLVSPVYRPPEALEGEVELIVRRVQVVQDRLERRISVDIVSDAEQETVSDVDEDRHFVQVVGDRGRFHR